MAKRGQIVRTLMSQVENAGLSAAERAALTQHEQVIERGLKMFIEVGLALTAIRDGKLYRATHESFERYLRDRWDLGRSHGYRLIEAAHQVGLIRDVSPNGDVPRSEAQTRELQHVTHLNIRAKIVDRIEKAGGWGNFTAREVGEVRDTVVAEWELQQRRAHSAPTGNAFANLVAALGRSEWALEDNYDLAPPPSLGAEARDAWLRDALAGTAILERDLSSLRRRIEETLAEVMREAPQG